MNMLLSIICLILSLMILLSYLHSSIVYKTFFIKHWDVTESERASTRKDLLIALLSFIISVLIL